MCLAASRRLAGSVRAAAKVLTALGDARTGDDGACVRGVAHGQPTVRCGSGHHVRGRSAAARGTDLWRRRIVFVPRGRTADRRRVYENTCYAIPNNQHSKRDSVGHPQSKHPVPRAGFCLWRACVSKRHVL